MKYKFFTIPICTSNEPQTELNNFCASHKIAAVEKQFVADGDKSFWAFCVSYLDGETETAASKKNKIDYREVLDEKDFALYAKLRSLRKKISEREGVPAYALFTNEQLATMVQKQVRTTAAMNAIEGIGKARMEKYGEAFLAVLTAESEQEDDPQVPDETHKD